MGFFRFQRFDGGEIGSEAGDCDYGDVPFRDNGASIITPNFHGIN
jgi:hypothetical protein